MKKITIAGITFAAIFCAAEVSETVTGAIIYGIAYGSALVENTKDRLFNEHNPLDNRVGLISSQTLENGAVKSSDLTIYATHEVCTGDGHMLKADVDDMTSTFHEILQDYDAKNARFRKIRTAFEKTVYPATEADFRFLIGHATAKQLNESLGKGADLLAAIVATLDSNELTQHQTLDFARTKAQQDFAGEFNAFMAGTHQTLEISRELSLVSLFPTQVADCGKKRDEEMGRRTINFLPASF